MDCYSAESDFNESLDFLSPPVIRINSSKQAFDSSYNTNVNNADVHLLRGIRHKFAQIAHGGGVAKICKAVKSSESSTSLVLKKTSEGQILGQQYSFVSFPSLHKTKEISSALLKSEKKPNTYDKPLIKVTVIPKKDQAAKLLRRRRYIPKRVYSTTSNHENSIQTKNVYLIVAGRRKEKIYEIKTTGSAKLSSDYDNYAKDEEVPIEELTNFQHLIQSMNMDRKKKKEKKQVPEAAESSEEQPRSGTGLNFFPNCICVDEKKDPHKKSRVRIFGQFGISKDEKYVLRYGATVNDKQVMSDVAQLSRDFSPVIAETSYGTTEEQSTYLNRLQQDSCLQADYIHDLENEKPPVKKVVSKESLGTQVNFNIQVAAPKRKCATFSDKKVQYNCCGNRAEYNTLKDCQSPMVIISVYPKPTPEDLLKTVHYPDESSRSTKNTPPPSPAAMATNMRNHVIKTEKASNKSDTRTLNYKISRMSRSPSPVRKVSKPKLPDDSLKPPVTEKRSPDRQKALRAIKEKIREKDKLKQDSSSRKQLPLKLNMSSATQVSKNFKNLTVSNATQISRRNVGLYPTSHATQMSNKKSQYNNISNGTQVFAKKIKNNATQYSDEAESFTTSNATQCGDTLGSLQDIAPIKHSINEAVASEKYTQRKPPRIKQFSTQVSQATQVPETKHYLNHATQITKIVPLTTSCATQVSKPNVITPRMAKGQETFIDKPTPGFNIEQASRLISKTKAEAGTNTDHARAKKVLVDTYTKKLTEQLMTQKHPARLDSSKVTINIDSDSQYYDVMFNRDKLISADFTIRKTIKDMGSQKFVDEPSLGIFLGLPDSALEREGFESGNKSPTKSTSIGLYNPSEDELPLPIMQHLSRVTIRDSLEICHRREDNKSNNNIKNTETCFSGQLADIGPDESEFLAPMKHFTGDDCSIIDPIERDKQIRELLGVDKVKPSYSKTSQGHFCGNNVGIPYQYIYRQRCKESQITEINYEYHKLCPYFKPSPSKDKANVSIQVRPKNVKTRLPKKTSEEDDFNYNVGEKKYENKSAIHQKLMLNRNTQVLLAMEQFSKQKPIILSRQQYDKVKKTIQKTISMKKSTHNKRKPLLTKCDSSEIYIGEIRTKKAEDAAVDTLQLKSTQKKERAALPEKIEKALSPLTAYTSQVSRHEIAAQTEFPCSKKNCKHLGRTDQRTRKANANFDKIGDFDYSPEGSPDSDEAKPPMKDGSACCVCQNVDERKETEVKTYVLFNAEDAKNLKHAEEAEHGRHTRKTMSSVEISYASAAFMKQLSYSSTDVGARSDSSIGHLNSFHTLFRGHRKCATPNLGTSAYSLYSENVHNSENKCAKLEPHDPKPKKPFLRRLMSCLVMRSTRNSEIKLPIGPPPNLPSVNSTIDSYHINTSLGAMEVTSSIYDTSASFYSNHTILPINSKIKKGFFSSVRGFLTNRKS